MRGTSFRPPAPGHPRVANPLLGTSPCTRLLHPYDIAQPKPCWRASWRRIRARGASAAWTKPPTRRWSTESSSARASCPRRTPTNFQRPIPCPKARPGLGAPLPNLHRDCAHTLVPSSSGASLVVDPSLHRNNCAGTGAHTRRHLPREARTVGRGTRGRGVDSDRRGVPCVTRGVRRPCTLVAR